jgi:hypothetical protein
MIGEFKGLLEWEGYIEERLEASFAFPKKSICISKQLQRKLKLLFMEYICKLVIFQRHSLIRTIKTFENGVLN